MLKRIRRYVWTVMIALMIVASGFATASASERAFEQNCSKCHARPSSVARSFDGNEEQRVE
jgi:cytochrome c5